MNRRLLTPVIENMTEADSISSLGVLRYGAPARAATSASPVASTTRPARIASRPGLALGDHAADDSVLDDRRDELAMQERLDPGLLDHDVRDVFEHLGVERAAGRLGLGRRRAHRRGPILELPADALAVDRLLVPIPGEALDADLGDVAAEATVTLEEGRAGAGPCGAEGGSQATRTATHDQDIGLVDDVDGAGGLGDSLRIGRGRMTHGTGPRSVEEARVRHRPLPMTGSARDGEDGRGQHGHPDGRAGRESGDVGGRHLGDDEIPVGQLDLDPPERSEEAHGEHAGGRAVLRASASRPRVGRAPSPARARPSPAAAGRGCRGPRRTPPPAMARDSVGEARRTRRRTRSPAGRTARSGRRSARAGRRT